MLKTKVIYVRQFWLLSGVWWYSEGEGVKSWDQSILKCGQRFWLSLLTWHVDSIDILMLSFYLDHIKRLLQTVKSVFYYQIRCAHQTSLSLTHLWAVYSLTPPTFPWMCISELCIFFIPPNLTQLWPTLCNSVDCKPPGSSGHGIFQARILQ